MTAGLPLMKNVSTPLAKSVVISLGLIAAASVTDGVIQKNIIGNFKWRNGRYKENS